MSKIEHYRTTLRSLTDWDDFLLKESKLPGPRANLELANLVADEGTEAQFRHFLTFDAQRFPANTPGEFLAVCGAMGLGRLLAQGDFNVLETLRKCASDPRWRVREGVAMALQRLGDTNVRRLLSEMERWGRGNFLEMRAAAATLSEPRLLRQNDYAKQTLELLDRITASIASANDRNTDEFRALKKGMGYCWSVAVAAYPTAGIPLMERWFSTTDKDVRWIMRENLKKKRLERMNAGWVYQSQLQLERSKS